jgi:hypothetical protein
MRPGNETVEARSADEMTSGLEGGLSFDVGADVAATDCGGKGDKLTLGF